MLAFYASKSSIEDIFTYSHIENISIVAFHKLPNSKTTTHRQRYQRWRIPLPISILQHIYIIGWSLSETVPHPGSSPSASARPPLIGIPPLPVLATDGIVLVSMGRNCDSKGYSPPHKRESTTIFQWHPLNSTIAASHSERGLGFPQCSLTCWFYIYAFCSYMITTSYSAPGLEACPYDRSQGHS